LEEQIGRIRLEEQIGGMDWKNKIGGMDWKNKIDISISFNPFNLNQSLQSQSFSINLMKL
jgi:hypothetical protein